MLQPINIRYSVRPQSRSIATGQVADWFGLADASETLIVAENLQLEIQPHELVLFTGPSGSGKSSLMRAIGQQLRAQDAMTINLPEVPLVDALTGPIPERLNRLSACGLAEPRLMLRRPSELSDGQRYRFRLAFALESQSAGQMVLLDEYAAYLDRTLAKVVSYNLRKWVSRSGIGLLLATTHEDIVADLAPDVWIRCYGEGRVEVHHEPKKKSPSVSPINFGSVKVPKAIGRISLGGIIDPIT
ncbi:MAG: ATP-binding cassette domain-containing protein [Gemmataceae bacterium]|jgi:ABC-type ATPase with predicted acetyltransferase domain|nr:ATP-binding cassette domain-containing protein [Gemmataceae bacterium]